MVSYNEGGTYAIDIRKQDRDAIIWQIKMGVEESPQWTT